MRLIDATPFDVKLMDIPSGSEDYEQGYIDGARHVLEDMEEAPTVDAVPLDKLCELCEETDARVPCVLCDKIMPEWCKQNNNLPLRWGEEWKCPTWKQLLTKWMEEQNENK